MIQPEAHPTQRRKRHARRRIEGYGYMASRENGHRLALEIESGGMNTESFSKR